jgi:hypothetical protein
MWAFLISLKKMSLSTSSHDLKLGEGLDQILKTWGHEIHNPTP